MNNFKIHYPSVDVAVCLLSLGHGTGYVTRENETIQEGIIATPEKFLFISTYKGIPLPPVEIESTELEPLWADKESAFVGKYTDDQYWLGTVDLVTYKVTWVASTYINHFPIHFIG